MDFFDTVVTEQANQEVERVLNSCRLSEGELVKRFEKSLEQTFKMINVVAVNSGTSALHLALVLAGVGEGDEVILPAQTFVATGMAILYCGAKPVFADIGMDGNIDLEDIKHRITEKTKAVILVAWGGNPCDYYLPPNDIPTIYDTAHALGATLHGEPLSEYAQYACYSFQAIKELTTGDGGLITCPDEETYKRARKLRWFGIGRDNDLADETGERQFNLEEVGFKYHMNDYAAALGLGNLHGFKERLHRRKQIAWHYDECWTRKLETVKKEGCSYWLYDILVERREDFMKAMKDRGVPTSVVHVGIDKHRVFGGVQDLPVQRYWDEHHVCLPIHSSLTDEDVEKVVEGVLKGW